MNTLFFLTLNDAGRYLRHFGLYTYIIYVHGLPKHVIPVYNIYRLLESAMWWGTALFVLCLIVEINSLPKPIKPLQQLEGKLNHLLKYLTHMYF